MKEQEKKTAEQIKREKELERQGIEIAKKLGEEQARTANGNIEKLKKEISNVGNLRIF